MYDENETWDDSDDYFYDNDEMEVLDSPCEDYDLCSSCYSVED